MLKMAVPWKEFIEADEALSRLQPIFAQLDNFVEFMSGLYAFEGPPPTIKVYDSPDFNAFATSDDEIHLPIGIIDHTRRYAELATFDEDAAHRSGLARIKQDLSLSWIVGHEFFHIARSHFAVLDQLGPSIRKAIEFDADMMATAGLYRYARAIELELPPLVTKGIVLNCIFWPVRMQIGSAIADHHEASSEYAAWHLRLCNIIDKLALLDTHPDQSLEMRDWERLMGSLLHLEKAYCQYHQTETSPVRSFIREERIFTDFEPLDALWQEVEPHVKALQRCKPGG